MKIVNIKTNKDKEQMDTTYKTKPFEKKVFELNTISYIPSRLMRRPRNIDEAEICISCGHVFFIANPKQSKDRLCKVCTKKGEKK